MLQPWNFGRQLRDMALHCALNTTNYRYTYAGRLAILYR